MCTIWTRRNARVNLGRARPQTPIIVTRTGTKKRPPRQESRVNSRLGSVSKLTGARPLQRQGRAAASAAAPRSATGFLGDAMGTLPVPRSLARARADPHPLSPSPPCGEGAPKGSPSFPLSTSWRGGQGVRAHESERACHPERRRREGPAGTSLFAAGDQRIGRRGVRAAWWSALRLESGPLTVGSNGRAVERSSLIVGSGRLRIVTDALTRGRRLLIAGSGPLTVVTDALTRGRRFLIAESGGPIGVTVALACGRPPLIAGSGRLNGVTTALVGGRRPLSA